MSEAFHARYPGLGLRSMSYDPPGRQGYARQAEIRGRMSERQKDSKPSGPTSDTCPERSRRLSRRVRYLTSGFSLPHALCALFLAWPLTNPTIYFIQIILFFERVTSWDDRKPGSREAGMLKTRKASVLLSGDFLFFVNETGRRHKM